MRQYYIVGRRLPTDKDPQPALLRLKIFAPNKVVARSRFWYFLKKTKGLKLKKASSEILTVQEVRLCVELCGAQVVWVGGHIGEEVLV